MSRRQRWTLIAAVLGSSIVFVDSSVVTVALPKIGRELPTTLLGVLEGQLYVYAGYLLTLSALLILAGALSDFYGRRRVFLIGLVGFGLTSVLCGLAPNMEFLVLSRILQGAAGAILVPGSLALLTATFSGEAQGRAYGVWAEGSHLIKHEEVSDEVLTARVRSKLGRAVSHPHAIQVMAKDGHVSLAGPRHVSSARLSSSSRSPRERGLCRPSRAHRRPCP